MSKKTIKAPVVTPSPSPNFARHLLNVGVDKLYLLGCLGQGWSIGALDGGAVDHEQFKDSTPRFVRRSFVANSPNPFKDNNNHGTCISSLLIGGPTSKPGQITVSSSPKVENYYHAKITSDNGNIVLDDVIKGLDWFLDLSKQGIGPDFVNMSFGEHFDKPYTDDIKGINQRMERLWDEYKTVFFVAAGNHGDDDNSVSWLAELPFTITVGAINYNNALGYLSPISPLIDLVGKGIGISAYHKSGTGYLVFDGTSQSVAVEMSKAVAICSWLTKHKGLPKRSIKENLLSCFKAHGFIYDLGPTGPDPQFGLGEIRFK